MKNSIIIGFMIAGFVMLYHLQCNAQKKYSLALHGGAGVMDREKFSPERQQEYLRHLDKALILGDSVLRKGGTSTDAVTTVVCYLENCPLFNAGKGAVFSWEGKNELDASIMDGATLQAGAVAAVTTIKNPILAAKEVKDHSGHVLLSGKGAEKYARSKGLDMVPNRYFHTRDRYESLKKLKEQSRQRSDADNHGTVGCVALDAYGNLCAGTSTGGMTGKRYGRIGDTPIIGAGTYASNRTCAVSCTGHGEYFIRLGVAKEVSALMEYNRLPLGEAANEAIKILTGLGGTGGLIAVDYAGNIAMPFNTSGMFRGFIKSTGEKEIAIFAP